MLPSDYIPAMTQVKDLIHEQRLPLREISRLAEVPYIPLWKWMKGKQKTINMLDGERIYFALTGKTFIVK